MRSPALGRSLRLFAVAGSVASFPASSFACIDGQFESHVTRSRAVVAVPAGAIQLQVDVPYDEDELRSLDQGKVTLPVKRVLHGSYEEKSIELDFRNSTSCEYFGPTGSGLYVVVNPWLYDEGDPVKDDHGKPIVNLIRYNRSVDPSYQGKLAPYPDGSTDIMKERKMFSCVRRGKETAEAIENCTDAENPDDLYRQGTAVAYWIATGFMTFAGVALAITMKLKK